LSSNAALLLDAVSIADYIQFGITQKQFGKSNEVSDLPRFDNIT